VDDFRDLILALNKYDVHYVIIGGYAVGVHYDPRTTKDLDVFVETSDENSRRIFAALREFGAPLSGMDAAFFAVQHEEWYQMGRPPFRVDVIQSISGKDFETAWRNKIVGTLFDAPVYVISKEDLIDNKLASGREVDRRDARNLKKKV
jgi:hypothetical protein